MENVILRKKGKSVGERRYICGRIQPQVSGLNLITITLIFECMGRFVGVDLRMDSKKDVHSKKL